MGWRDNYRAASFRGVSFYVESAESSHGRRQAVHEHAQRDVPYTEDLGRKAREFSVSGYVIGEEYQTQRDELIKACEQAGPGVLVHPYRGELTVVCRGLGLNESSSAGGMCMVTLTFIEAGEASYPSAKLDTINAISAKGNAVTEAAEGSFISNFLTKGFPAFVAEAAASNLAELGEFLSSPGFNLTGDLQAASDFYLQARGIAADAYSLVQQPAQMVSRIVSVIGSIRSAFGGNAFGVLTSLFDRSPSSYSSSTATASRKQQASNFLSLNSLVRQVAIAEAAKAAVVTQTPVISTSFSSSGSTGAVGGSALVSTTPTVYDSYQEAIVVREALVDRLDAESETSTSDSVYRVIADLRTSVVQAVPSQEQDLPRLVQYVPPATLPSLLVAYQLYGDAGRADEIAKRNSPRHPGFLIGGKQLEVLADG
jgi:prophage DNA circulation protein